MKRMIIGAVAVCLSATQWAEAVWIEFSGTPDSGPVSMTFSQDVNFTVTSALNYQLCNFFIADLFATPDGDESYIQNFTSQLEFSVNGGTHHQVSNWIDNKTSPSGVIALGDGVFGSMSQVLTAGVGDVITLHAGSMVSGSAPGSLFNLGTSGDYTMFITDFSGNQVTEAIPEPATLTLIGLFGVGTLFVRRWIAM